MDTFKSPFPNLPSDKIGNGRWGKEFKAIEDDIIDVTNKVFVEYKTPGAQYFSITMRMLFWIVQLLCKLIYK